MSARRPIIVGAVATTVAAVAALYAKSRRHAPLPTVPYVDLPRYAGKWYEIARLPASFEKDCTSVTAQYTIRPDGDVTVVNTCHKHTPMGKVKKAEGLATVADPTTNAKLKVQFFWPFKGDYWILALDSDYRYAMVGEPSRENLWLLSRTPQLPVIVQNELVQRGQELGFPVEKLIFTQQAPPAF
ncbi:lipocalin family protein [Hymenobacter profundi]|uniref:Lipocalin family protein n=1 Tax=Hymenobacter profundi TaxID=1982110 RepID=A0ABS6WW27_9BACT|nr:lipocalin family protein [Hymenobacter profundi]MBW3127807.1 lipocalin family protein [Hymenobacter profundi]